MKLPGLMKLSEDQCNLGIKGSKLGIHRSVNTQGLAQTSAM